MKNTEIIKKALHKADGVLYPVAGRKDKVFIVLSGSEGGLEHAGKLAEYLVSVCYADKQRGKSLFGDLGNSDKQILGNRNFEFVGQ